MFSEYLFLMKKKLIVGFLVSVLVIVFLFIGSIRLFVQFMYNSNSCEQFNIDNLELRTGIDIPSVISVDCKCDGQQRNSEFLIDPKGFNLNRYLDQNDFVFEGTHYINKGENDKTSWAAMLKPENLLLTVHIDYLDSSD